MFILKQQQQQQIRAASGLASALPRGRKQGSDPRRALRCAGRGPRAWWGPSRAAQLRESVTRGVTKAAPGAVNTGPAAPRLLRFRPPSREGEAALQLDVTKTGVAGGCGRPALWSRRGPERDRDTACRPRRAEAFRTRAQSGDRRMGAAGADVGAKPGPGRGLGFVVHPELGAPEGTE